MEEQDPIAQKRSRGGSLDVGDDTDGAIQSMMTIGQKIFAIKDRSIYEIVTADTLDPDRTSINVPNMAHKLVINQGIQSQVVSQTFLTASMFFKKDRLPEGQLVRVWELIVELTREALNLEQHIQGYYQKEKKEKEKYETARSGGIQPAIPSIPDLETSLKSIFQKGEHMYQILMELTSVLLPKMKINKQGHFDTLAEIVSDKIGPKSGFAEFLNQNLDLLKTIKEIRNGLDHRQPKVKVKDYQYNLDTTISLPTIALDAKTVKLPEIAISDYLGQVMSLFSFAEIMICHLANLTIKSIMQSVIREIPIEQRIYEHVRYCFYIPTLDFYQQ
jgi:hypothetical protein